MTDWKQIDGKWYYFYPTGAMVNPGKRIIDGKTYIFDENGAMLTGWKQIASV
ncbi:choline-binding protein A [Bacillus clarus]|uniref:choline-binding protein A n=1 Tax=Bacillus clarus TaxID=2338372 RepID=UPI000AD178C2